MCGTFCSCTLRGSENMRDIVRMPGPYFYILITTRTYILRCVAKDLSLEEKDIISIVPSVDPELGVHICMAAAYPLLLSMDTLVYTRHVARVPTCWLETNPNPHTNPNSILPL